MRRRLGLVLWVVGVLTASALPSQGWVDRTSGSGPSPRYGHAMCYDPVRGYTLMVGGASNNITTFPETWRWDGATWAQLGSAPVPSGSGYWSEGPICALTFHAATGTVLLVVRSSLGPGSGTLDSYSWDGATWSPRGSTGINSYYSDAIAMAYDALRQETIVYSLQDRTRVGVWNGTTWSVRVNAVSPSIDGSSPMAMAWDSTIGRIVLAGRGQPGSAVRLYEWSGFGWNQRLPTTLPPSAGAMATDSVHQRVILVDSDYSSAQPNHTWMLTNGVFTRLNTPLEPTLREDTAMAFDPVRGVCVLFGGSNNYPMGDTWEFDLGPIASFTPYGGGCFGSRGTPTLAAQGTSTPRLGTTFQAHVSNLPWTGPALLLVGLSDTSYANTPLPFDLSALGAPTCNLLTSIEQIHALNNVLGSASWSFQVPPFPGASFYVQVLPLDPGVNALGLTASNGARGIIGL